MKTVYKTVFSSICSRQSSRRMNIACLAKYRLNITLNMRIIYDIWLSKLTNTINWFDLFIRFHEQQQLSKQWSLNLILQPFLSYFCPTLLKLYKSIINFGWRNCLKIEKFSVTKDTVQHSLGPCWHLVVEPDESVFCDWWYVGVVGAQGSSGQQITWQASFLQLTW